MAETANGSMLQHLIDLMHEADHQDATELFHAADSARTFLRAGNKAFASSGYSRITKHNYTMRHECLQVYNTLQALVTQGRNSPGSTVFVSIDIEAGGPSADEPGAVDPEIIQELGIATHTIGDTSNQVHSKRYVVASQRTTPRRMAKGFDKGVTELVRHQVLLSHRLSAAIHEFQEKFETVVLVGWDLRMDLAWLEDRIDWVVPAGVVVVDVQLAAMHKHDLDWRPKLLDMLDDLERFEVSQWSDDTPRITQMHNAGYDAYWTLLLALSVGGAAKHKATSIRPPPGNFLFRVEVVGRDPWTLTHMKSKRRVVYQCFLHGKLSRDGKVSNARLSHKIDVNPPEDDIHWAAVAGMKRKGEIDGGIPNKRFRVANGWVEC